MGGAHTNPENGVGREAFTLLEVLLAGLLSLIVVLILGLLIQSSRQVADFVQAKVEDDRSSEAVFVEEVRRAAWNAMPPPTLSNDVADLMTFSQDGANNWMLRWSARDVGDMVQKELRSVDNAGLSITTRFSTGLVVTNAMLATAARMSLHVEGREVEEWPGSGGVNKDPRLPSMVVLTFDNPTVENRILFPSGVFRRPKNSDEAGEE